MTEGNRMKRLACCKQLFKRFPEHAVSFLWFTDEKLFTVAHPVNLQIMSTYRWERIRSNYWTPDFISPLQWPPNSSDITLCNLGCSTFYHEIISAAVTRWRARLHACVKADQGHFEHFMTIDEWSHWFIGDNWTCSLFCYWNLCLSVYRETRSLLKSGSQRLDCYNTITHSKHSIS